MWSVTGRTSADGGRSDVVVSNLLQHSATNVVDFHRLGYCNQTAELAVGYFQYRVLCVTSERVISVHGYDEENHIETSQ